MAQLLAGGFILLGALIFGILIYILSRDRPVSLPTAKAKSSAPLAAKPEQQLIQTPATQVQATNNTPTPSRELDDLATTTNSSSTQPHSNIVQNDVPAIIEPAKPTPITLTAHPLPAWWHEQFQSLTVQLQYLRQHAKDVEQQIAILSEIARLAAELEAIQSKHVVLSGDKPLQFPRRVSRETMDGAYLTDKRPAVRKYTIKAM